MDLPRMKDFLQRLAQGYDQAIRSGDKQKAEQFKQLIAQTEPVVQRAVSQPPPNTKPAPYNWQQEMNGPQQAAQLTIPQGAQQPPSPVGRNIMGDLKQETGPSWFEKLMQTPQVAGIPNQPADMQAHTQPSPESWTKNLGVLMQDNPYFGGMGQYLANKDAAPSDTPKPNPALDGLFKNTTNNQTPLRAIGPEGVVEGNDLPSGEQSYNDPERQDQRDAWKKIQHDRLLADRTAELGDDPNKWNLGDFLGLLFGGKNYLESKERSGERYTQRKLDTHRDVEHLMQQRDLSEEMRGMKEKALAVEYAKNLAEQDDKAEGRLTTASDNMVRSLSQPGASVNDSFVKSEKLRLQNERAAREDAIAARRKRMGQ